MSSLLHIAARVAARRYVLSSEDLSNEKDVLKVAEVISGMYEKILGKKPEVRKVNDQGVVELDTDDEQQEAIKKNLSKLEDNLKQMGFTPDKGQFNSIYLKNSAGVSIAINKVKSNKTLAVVRAGNQIDEESIKKKAEGLTKLKKEKPERYEEVLKNIKDLARGEGDEKFKKQYLPGWSPDALRSLLEAAGEKAV